MRRYWRHLRAHARRMQADALPARFPAVAGLHSAVYSINRLKRRDGVLQCFDE